MVDSNEVLKYNNVMTGTTQDVIIFLQNEIRAISENIELELDKDLICESLLTKRKIYKELINLIKLKFEKGSN